MENTDILKSRIGEKIEELNKIENLSFHTLNSVEGYDQIDAVTKKLKSVRRLYLWIQLPLTILLVSLVTIASFLQVFDYKIFNWDKAGLAIIFSLSFLMYAWRSKLMIERLKMMQFLIELKNEIG